MTDLEHGGQVLGRIHKRNNDRKFFCHLTGFLEGIVASRAIEPGELEPLLAECQEFVEKNADGDAFDIIADFEADLLEYTQIVDAVEYRNQDIDPDCEKSRLNHFLGYCRGIVCDGKITLEEAKGILDYLKNYPQLHSVVGVSQILTTCTDAVDDDKIDKEEEAEICEVIGQIVGDCYGDTGLAQTFGVANVNEHKIDSLDMLKGATIVLTGTFRVKPRRIFEQKLEGFGAIITKHVSGNTKYVIIAGKASRDWIEMHRGTKIRKAQQLRMQSDKPLFVSESQLLRLIDF
jgi:hypothetical protein